MKYIITAFVVMLATFGSIWAWERTQEKNYYSFYLSTLLEYGQLKCGQDNPSIELTHENFSIKCVAKNAK